MIIWRNRDEQLVLQSISICQRAIQERQARSDKLNFDRMIDCKIVSYMTAIITLNFIAKSDVFYDSVMQMSKTHRMKERRRNWSVRWGCAGNNFVPKAMRPHLRVTLMGASLLPCA